MIELSDSLFAKGSAHKVFLKLIAFLLVLEPTQP